MFLPDTIRRKGTMCRLISPTIMGKKNCMLTEVSTELHYLYISVLNIIYYA